MSAATVIGRTTSPQPPEGLLAFIVDQLTHVIPDVVTGTFVLHEDVLGAVPIAARSALDPYRGCSVVVFAVPITDDGLWVWHRHGEYRSLLANYVLLRAQEEVARAIPAGVKIIDLATLTRQRVSMSEAGVLAGIGTRGWNNLLLHPKYGSWLQIHAFVVNSVFAASPRIESSVCIECSRCIDACPVSALTHDSFHAARCSSVVANPTRARSRAIALTASTYIECRECIDACPIGARPEGLFAWKR